RVPERRVGEGFLTVGQDHEGRSAAHLFPVQTQVERVEDRRDEDQHEHRCEGGEKSPPGPGPAVRGRTAPGRSWWSFRGWGALRHVCLSCIGVGSPRERVSAAPRGGAQGNRGDAKSMFTQTSGVVGILHYWYARVKWEEITPGQGLFGGAVL